MKDRPFGDPRRTEAWSLTDEFGETPDRCQTPAHDGRQGRSVGPRDILRVTELEQELEAVRTELQGARRNLEISCNAQAAIKEEALLVDQEHQSTKKELLASKDELQALSKEFTALKSLIRETPKQPCAGSNAFRHTSHGPAAANLYLSNGTSDPWDSSTHTDRRQTAVNHLAGLTPRQHEIMGLVLAGRPSKNIAAHLGISQRTVENHRASIMRKTGSKSLPALTRLALVAGGSGASDHFFCSTACRDKFEAAPAIYAKASGTSPNSKERRHGS